MAIPIVNARRQIVGWTDAAPQIYGYIVSHPDAERLIGKPIVCVYIRILNPDDALRAGAPRDWPGEWRCLALCSERALSPKSDDGVMPVQHAA
jgi:hypothetical protein